MSGAPLSCDVSKVVPGQSVEVKAGKELHAVEIPADAAIGKRIWKQVGGQWIDFTVTPLCGIDAAVSGSVLKIAVTPNLNVSQGSMVVEDREYALSMRNGESQQFEIPIAQKRDEIFKNYAVEIRTGDFRQRENIVVVAESRNRHLASLPISRKTGMRLKKSGKDSPVLDDSGAHVSNYPEMSCGEIAKKKVLFMHPPYRKGSGFTYVEYQQVDLPEAAAALRAFVGKRDGSDLGDGIFFRVEVKADGKWKVAGSTHVAKHEWQMIEADLREWAGKTVALRLVSDAGDNTNGDWGGWCDMRIESLAKELVWSLLPDAGSVLSPSPHPLQGVTLADLRKAKRGFIRYEGIGLAGRNPVYGTFGLLNKQELGNMIPAGGNEKENVWNKPVELPLTEEALKSLKMHNVFEVYNPGNDCFKLRNICLVGGIG